MKFADLASLEKALDVEALPHVVACSLHADFDAKSLEKRLLELFLRGEDAKLALKTFSGEQSGLQDKLAEELNAFSFFAGKTTVLLTEAESLSKADLSYLESYLENPNPNAQVLLFAEGSLPGKLKTLSDKAGYLLEIVQEKFKDKERRLVHEVMNRFHQEGKRLSYTLCQQILQQAGHDSSVIRMELDKLLLYIGDRKDVKAEDLRIIHPDLNLGNIWKLGESIFNRQKGRAISLMRQLLNDGISLSALIHQLRQQFQTDCQVASILRQGGSQQAITQSFPYMKGWILDQHIRSAKNYGLRAFQKGLTLLEKEERRAKSRQLNTEIQLETLIIKLCQAA